MYKLVFKYIQFSILTIICLINIACSGVNLTEWHFPYMMEVQQGTYITEEGIFPGYMQ